MIEVDFLGKGWRFPVAVQDQKVAYAETEESIREAILIILNTSKGERVMRPDFGCDLNAMVFAPNNMVTATLIIDAVTEALLKWEPRIEVDEVTAEPDATEASRLNIGITYRIKTSNIRRNLVYPFFLQSR